MLQTVNKIGPILDLFTAESPEWGVSQVAEAIGAPRSTTHALLSSLVSTGLLQTRGRGRYRIGWRVLELNEVLRAGVDLRALAAAPLLELSKQLRETVQLGVLEGERVLYIDKIVGPQVLTVNGAALGTRLEAHASAIGKVMLAHQDRAQLERRLHTHQLRRFTDRTIVDPAELLSHLRAVAQRGYAIDDGEILLGVCCVAAPIRDEHGMVVAAISATMPETRFRTRLAEARTAVQTTAKAVSENISRAADSGKDGITA